MIVITIMGIWTAIAIPVYNNFARSSRAKTRYTPMHAAIDLIQTEAVKDAIAEATNQIDASSLLNKNLPAIGSPKQPGFVNAVAAQVQIAIAGLTADSIQSSAFVTISAGQISAISFT